MMVKQQQRRTDRCFLPVGSNNVTLVRFPTQRQSQHPAREANHPAPVQENQDGETETKRICISGSEETLTNGEADAELHDPIGNNTSSVEDQESPGHGAQQVVSENSEGNRAAELVSAGCLKVTIQRSSESREFGEKDPSSERFTCHICHCSCPSAQSFQLHMSGVDHQLRLQRITQSLAVTQHTGRRSGASERWCDVCQSHFTGDIILHRRTKEHKECKKCGRPFCPVCHRHFRTPRKFVEHMKSPEHKQQVQMEKSHEGEMITVDAVGCFETESKTKFASDPGDKEVVACDGAEEQSDTGDIAQEEIETAVTQEFNPHTVYGSAYVVPVRGFFCRLCHKFFFRETSARDQHCRSHQHFSRLLQRQRGPDQTQDSADPASCSTHSTME
ncbi:unnamed protein product [Knipowitschia caucasica]